MFTPTASAGRSTTQRAWIARSTNCSPPAAHPRACSRSAGPPMGSWRFRWCATRSSNGSCAAGTGRRRRAQHGELARLGTLVPGGLPPPRRAAPLGPAHRPRRADATSIHPRLGRSWRRSAATCCPPSCAGQPPLAVVAGDSDGQITSAIDIRILVGLARRASEVLHQREQPVDVVVDRSQCRVAPSAEQSTDCAGGVVVIDVKPVLTADRQMTCRTQPVLFIV